MDIRKSLSINELRKMAEKSQKRIFRKRGKNSRNAAEFCKIFVKSYFFRYPPTPEGAVWE